MTAFNVTFVALKYPRPSSIDVCELPEPELLGLIDATSNAGFCTGGDCDRMGNAAIATKATPTRSLAMQCLIIIRDVMVKCDSELRMEEMKCARVACGRFATIQRREVV